MIVNHTEDGEEDITITVSGTSVTATEVIILTMFFSLFFYSIFSLISIWNRTYGEIGPASYYLYEGSSRSSSPPALSHQTSYSRDIAHSRRMSRRMSRRGNYAMQPSTVF